MFKLYFFFKTIFFRAVRLIFNYINGGIDCIICNHQTFNYPVCGNCIKKYFSVDENLLKNRCLRCGRKLISTTNLCSKCKEEITLKNADFVLPLFSYRLWNKELLFLWKIQGIRNLSYFFASLINKAMKLNNLSIIVPVPPRKGKIKKKGWDQIDELCSILHGLYGYICLKILNRTTKSEQKKLTRNERLETIKNAYEIVCRQKMNKELKKVGGKLPKSVTLIDDVCTTGATVESCCKILKQFGVEEVNVITLFIVD